METVDSQRQLEVINETELTPADDQAFRQFLAGCFDPDAADFFSQSRHWHGSAPEYSVVGHMGGRICAHVGVIVRRVRCAAEEVLVAGIQNFGVGSAFRGAGLGPWLMRGAMEEAGRRQISFGLLFCVPGLERYYGGMGWLTIDVPVTMRLHGGYDEPIPGKNICMVLLLAGRVFPQGPIHLQGPDW